MLSTLPATCSAVFDFQIMKGISDMKKSIVVILLPGLAVLILLIAAASLIKYNKQLSSDEAALESEADAALLTLHEMASEAGSAETEPDEQLIIWAGDSRTVGMQNAMKNNDIYIGASGEGYQWLSETGLPQITDAIASYPDSPVVFNFGVNDYDNLSNYLALYESLMQEYPDTHFYFLAVYPVDDAVCKYITNAEISDFNDHLQSLSPERYLDSYTWLMTNEILTIDGIHYSEEDYRALHAFASELIREKEK